MVKLFRSIDNLAREHTERAVRTITEIMDNPFSEDRDRLKAAEQILDRGHGKPLTATIQVPANRAQAALLAAMSDEELLNAISQAQLPRLNAPRDFIDVVAEQLDPILR